MPTPKQKRVARLLIENLSGGLKQTAGKMLENAGYGKGVAKYPARVLRSRGVREELDVLGFDPEDAKKAVARVLTFGNNMEVISAAKEIFKVSGTYPKEKLEIGVDERMEKFLDKWDKRLK